PPLGRQRYQLLYGEKAMNLVKEARTQNNFVAMAQALGRYLYTDAGAEACNWCAAYQLDRANFTAAANYYYILIQRETTKDKPGVRGLKDGQLVKAAFVFHQIGDSGAKFKADCLKELERRNATIILGGEKKTVADLKDELAKYVPAQSTEASSD